MLPVSQTYHRVNCNNSNNNDDDDVRGCVFDGVACARDVMCGMLHCHHLSEKLMFWKEALAFTMPEAWVLVNNTRYDCKGAILDVGLYMPDPGMVPDGAMCAQRHVSITISLSLLLTDRPIARFPHPTLV